MASTYTTSLRIEKPGTGEQSGTWGATVNTSYDLMEKAVAGYLSIAMADANVTLTTANGSSDQARNAVIELTGTNTATRECIVPAVSKVYVIKNSTTQSVTVKTSGGTGPTILTGKTAIVYCDGTNANLVGVAETNAITAISGVTPAADALPYFTGAAAASVTTLTSFARTILDDADAATVRTTIGLGSLATLSTINNANWSGTALAVANGGTGSTTASAARTALGLGTLSTLNTINNSNWSGTALAVANGGTGASDAATARTNLGLVIGTNVQAYSANLATYSGITPSANVQSLLGAVDYSAMRTQLSLVVGTNVQAFNTGLTAIATVTPAADALPYFTGASTASTTTLSAFARTLLDDADAVTMRTTLGVSAAGTSLQVASNLSDLNNVATARSNLGVSASGADTAYAWRSNNLSDLASASIARTNLGVTATGADTTYAYRANNLSDLASASTARTNLGLGSLAVLSTVNDANWSGTDLAVANGGTGASTASGARTNLGLVIGTDVQAYNAGLAAIATVTPAADALPYFTGASTAAVTTLSSFIRTLLDDVDAATARATLGVGASGTALQVSNNLSDVASAATSRTNLGLGTSATINTGTSGTTIPLLDGTNTWSGNQSVVNTGASSVFTVGGSAAFEARLNLSNAAGQLRQLAFQTGGTIRWSIRANSTAESGSNAGSDLAIVCYSDAGAAIATPVQITRSTGAIIINTSLTIGGVAVPTISSTDTLSNKTLSSPTLSGTVAGTPTISSAWTWSTAQNFPTNSQVNGSNIVTLAATQTLTNKTLTSPVISTIVNTGTLTLPTSTDTLVGRATTDTLTNKTLTSPVISTIVNTGTLTLPTSTDTLVGRATTDTLTNKTLTSPVISGTVNGAFTVADSLSWTSAQNFAANSQVAGSNIVTLAATQTLTNKTLTSPTINGAALSGTFSGSVTFSGNNTYSGTSTFTSTAYSRAAWGAVGVLSTNDASGIGMRLSATGAANDAVIFQTTSDSFSSAITTVTITPSTGVWNFNVAPTIGGVAVPTISSTSTLTNKTLSSPTLSGTVAGTPTISSAWTWSTAQNFPTNSQVNGSNIVTLAATQTLTNKTLTSPVISTIVNTGTLTLPTSTDTLVGRATTDTLTNKTLTSPVISTIVNTGTLTLPTSTDTLVGRATTDTLTNKTLTSPVISTIVNTGTLTLPTSTDTLVGRATTDTLTNKTLTSPTINGGSSSAGVQDSSETTGSLTSASANKRVVCSGNVTLPASGMTSGQMVMIDPAGTARTITRPAAHTMYVNDTDSATATTKAHNIAMAVFHGSSKYTLHGTA